MRLVAYSSEILSRFINRCTRASLGAVTATLGLITPCVIVILLFCMILNAFRNQTKVPVGKV